MEPVRPFEPVRTETIPTAPFWIGQVKWDGVRVLTYKESSGTKLFNRRLNERTHHYPELQNFEEYCSANSVILDGEIIALKDSKPSFYKVMKRDGITNFRNMDILCKAVPITYMVFDVLYYSGEWINNQPLYERQEILKKIIKPVTYVQVVESFEDASALYEVVKKQELEGIVIKDLNSTYLINGKDSRWKKKKYYRDLIAVVGGVTLRGTIVNSLLLGLYDPSGKLWYIGHAGTGKLSQKDWRDSTEKIQSLIVPEMPFTNRPPRYKDSIWLKPILSVKVNFIEWLEGHFLRQPSIQAFVKADPVECRLPTNK
jgi:bifunctional non-homologous end joining protein LigD